MYEKLDKLREEVERCKSKIEDDKARLKAAEAKPGDLIFFKGTYNTSGASHVGIYVGDGMMLHCGKPIQYASCETSYWQSHFYCFGRLS